jgi:preprotein translocase subunit SecG
MDTWSSLLLGILFLIVCVLLIIIILLQKGRGGGLGAAFGGGGQSAFGTRTGDVFTWITIVLTGLFLLLAIGTSKVIRPEQKPLAPPRITPTASAAVPGVDGKISVHISSDERGSEVFYTINGQDPVPDREGTNKFSTIPVQVPPGTTVKAIARRIGRTSAVTTEHFPTETEKADAAKARDALLTPATPEGESNQSATEPGQETTEPAAMVDPPTGAVAGPTDPAWVETPAEADETEEVEPSETE